MDIEKVFNAIKSFVTEINSLYGAHYKPLALYGRLVEKTNLTHKIPVNKHINAFKKFMISNRNAIYNMNEQEFKPHKIQYNDNVYFNMKTIMNMADPDTQQVIWQHLLVLSALLDHDSKAKQRIKEHQQALIAQESSTNNAGVDPMLSNIMNIVSSMMMDSGNSSSGSSGSDENNMNDIGQIFGKIASSNILPKMMSTISSNVKDGQIDIGNIVNSVRSLAQECNLNLPPLQNEDEQVDKILDMFNGFGLDKSKMKEMVSAFQQHIVEDTDENCHTSVEKNCQHTNDSSVEESVPALELILDAKIQNSVVNQVSDPFMDSIESKSNLDLLYPSKTEVESKYECRDDVCYIK